MRGAEACDEGSKEENEGTMRNKREMVTMNRRMEGKIMKCGMRDKMSAEGARAFEDRLQERVSCDRGETEWKRGSGWRSRPADTE